MTTLTTRATTDGEGRLQLDFKTGLNSCDVDVVVVIQPCQPHAKDPRRLLTLRRKLSWQGDPMEIQREMRSEWPD
jgi:hypothetical protein